MSPSPNLPAFSVYPHHWLTWSSLNSPFLSYPELSDFASKRSLSSAILDFLVFMDSQNTCLTTLANPTSSLCYYIPDWLWSTSDQCLKSLLWHGWVCMMELLHCFSLPPRPEPITFLFFLQVSRSPVRLVAALLQNAGWYTFYDVSFIYSVVSRVEIAKKTEWKQFRIIVMAIIIIP